MKNLLREGNNLVKTRLLDLIKTRATTRFFIDKPIPKNILRKIINAGVWGPSVLSFQPAMFVVITRKSLITKISEAILGKSKDFLIGRNVLHSISQVLLDASVVVLIYNTRIASNRVSKLNTDYAKIVTKAEIEAIAASIQNMILISEALNIGSCWLDIPLLCQNEINKIVGVSMELCDLLLLGYPRTKRKRSKRKRASEMIKILE